MSDLFRHVVEKIEPGVHQFFPVEIYWSDQDKAEGNFYWFNICTALDTVDPQKTEATQRSGTSKLTGKFKRLFWQIDRPTGGIYPLYYKLQSVQGAHIWKDMYSHSGSFCSDTFKHECKKFDLSGLGFTGPLEAS